MNPYELADRVLQAFASSDLAAVQELCREDAVVFGTDTGEVWWERESLLHALDGMRELGLEARWVGERRVGVDWVAGWAEFRLRDGSTVPARVSMTFADGVLVHAHYSVPAVA
jgi:hypothetical protein